MSKNSRRSQMKKENQEVNESLQSGSIFLKENTYQYTDEDFKGNRWLNLPCENYQKLKTIAEEILEERCTYMKLRSAGFMDLVIERLDESRISLSHYYVQNGDLMADPDMELIIDKEKEAVYAATFQQDNLGIYHIAYNEGEVIDEDMAEELNEFLDEWLSNLLVKEYAAEPRLSEEDDEDLEP